MQCSSCGASYSKELDNCPECQPASLGSSTPGSIRPDRQPRNSAKTKTDKPRKLQQKSPKASTLIEFPGGGRVPQWRKELSERVREVQKRRALEAENEARTADRAKKQASRSPEPAPLGLVPQPAAPTINPLVMKALLRIERAHHAPASTTPSFRRGAAALARLPEETAEVDSLPASFPPESSIAGTAAESVLTSPANERSPKDHGFVVVPPQLSQAVTAAGEPKKMRSIGDEMENATLSYLENLPAKQVIFETSRDDRARFAPRIMAAFLDLTVAAFVSCPFAAAIELGGANWNDLRVKGLMIGIVIAVTFLYLTISTALTGRSLGMRLFRIRAVDVDTGLMPSGAQSARRSVGYIFSLATAGLGILYGLVDAEHRTAHDHFSGTIVVHD